MDKALQTFLARSREKTVFLGKKQLTLRLLSARQMLELEKEAEDKPDLWCDAALLAQSLQKNKKPVFSDPEQVLDSLTAAEILALVDTYAEFDQAVNPTVQGNTQEVLALKKDWGTQPMSV